MTTGAANNVLVATRHSDVEEKRPLRIVAGLPKLQLSFKIPLSAFFDIEAMLRSTFTGTNHGTVIIFCIVMAFALSHRVWVPLYSIALSRSKLCWDFYWIDDGAALLLPAPSLNESAPL